MGVPDTRAFRIAEKIFEVATVIPIDIRNLDIIYFHWRSTAGRLHFETDVSASCLRV